MHRNLNRTRAFRTGFLGTIILFTLTYPAFGLEKITVGTALKTLPNMALPVLAFPYLHALDEADAATPWTDASIRRLPGTLGEEARRTPAVVETEHQRHGIAWAGCRHASLVQSGTDTQPHERADRCGLQ